MLRSMLVVATLVAGNAASAATLSLMSGDDDCFGVNDPCDAGDILVVAGNFDNSTASDPAGQDQFGNLGTSSFNFALDSLALNNALSASFSFKALGLDLVDTGAAVGDAFAGARILLNGADIGLYAPNIAPTEVDLVSFAVDTSDLMANNVFTIIPEEAFAPLSMFDSYAIDFAKLTVELDMSSPPPGGGGPGTPGGPSVVPLPASGMFLLGGLGALALRRRKNARG